MFVIYKDSSEAEFFVKFSLDGKRVVWSTDISMAFVFHLSSFTNSYSRRIRKMGYPHAYEGKIEPPETKVELKVVVISSNTGSFGHNAHILFDRKGNAYEGLRISGSGNKPLKQGDILVFDLDERGSPTNCFKHGFEIMNNAPQGKPPATLVEEVWNPNYGKKN